MHAFFGTFMQADLRLLSSGYQATARGCTGSILISMDRGQPVVSGTPVRSAFRGAPHAWCSVLPPSLTASDEVREPVPSSRVPWTTWRQSLAAARTTSTYAVLVILVAL